MRASFRFVRSRNPIVVSMLCAALFLAACGGGGGDGSGDDAGEDAGAGDVDQFCELIEGAVSGIAGLDPTTEEGVDATRQYYEQVEAVSPQEIRADVTAVLETVDTLAARTFDVPTAEELQSFSDATTRINEYVEVECAPPTSDTESENGS